MKKKQCRSWIGLLLAACMLSGCGEQEIRKDEILLQEEMPAVSEELITVGFAQIGSESDWRNASTQSFRDTFTEKNGYYLLFEDAQQKQENQLKAIRNFILQGVDYIVLSPIVETGWDSVLQEVKDAGIPLILTDRFVDTENKELYTCYVGSNFTQAGIDAGKWLERYLREAGREEETINIVTLQGTYGSSAQLGRTEGFEVVRKQHQNWNMLDRQTGDFTQAKGQEVMEEFLKQYPDIDVVVCENDNMAFGAIDAIHQAGKTCGPDGDMIILSFDATSTALQAMIDGELNASFECNPQLGPYVSEIIEHLETGKHVDKIQYVKEAYFDTSMDLEEIIKTRTY